jgi:hypothetical protein
MKLNKTRRLDRKIQICELIMEHVMVLVRKWMQLHTVLCYVTVMLQLCYSYAYGIVFITYFLIANRVSRPPLPPTQGKILTVHLQQPATYPYPSRLQSKILYFIDGASRYKFLLITNLTHFFNMFIYFASLHVSNNPVLIIRRINCINTSYGMYHSV